MNNMYDILDKMKLLEGRGLKPDFLDLDKDGNRKEPMKQAARQAKVDEVVGPDYDVPPGEPVPDSKVVVKPIKEKDMGQSSVVKTSSGFSASAPSGQQLTVTLPKGRPLSPGDVKTKSAGMNEAASKTARMARIAKMCARDAYSNVDRKMYLKAAELFAAGDEQRGLDAIERMDTEARDYFYMDCEKAGIPVPVDEGSTGAAQRKVIKKNGRPVGEVGIDPDAPPGRPGQWYMKHYASGHNLGGYDSREEAMSELKHCLSQEMSKGVSEGDVRPDDEDEFERRLAKDRKENPEKYQWSDEKKRFRKMVKNLDQENEQGMEEADMEEGNDFTGARLAAIKAGKPTFSVAGKTYKVTGDTSDEKMMEKKEKVLWPGTPEYEKKFPKDMRPGEKKKSSTGGTIEKTATGVKHTAKSHDDEEGTAAKDDGAPKKRGRPKGPAKGPERVTAKAWKHKGGRVKEDYQSGEYDREGEMAKSQSRTIADAAEELQSMLGDDENLPEWVQKKIAIAQEYIDSARDYLKSNRPGDDGEEAIAEKAVSKAQRAAAGIAYAAKKGEIPKSQLRGASKEMAKMGTGELKKFAKTKEKGLPEKVKSKKEESKEEVEETTTSGSVATAPAEAPKGKKGMIFGKGIYEGYDQRFRQLLAEGMSINASQNEDGSKSLTVNATDEDAVKLAQILRLAGMEQAHGYEEACSSCGQAPCGCEGLEEGEYANSPEEVAADINTLVNTYSDGLNGQKTTGQTTIPVIAGQTQRMVSQVREEAESRLWDLYKRYDTK